MLLNPYSWPGAEHKPEQHHQRASSGDAGAGQQANNKENDHPLQLHQCHPPNREQPEVTFVQGILQPLDQLLCHASIAANGTLLQQKTAWLDGAGSAPSKLQLHRVLVELGETVVQAQARLHTLDDQAAQATERKAQLQAQFSSSTSHATRAWMGPLEQHRGKLVGILQQAQSLAAQLADCAQISNQRTEPPLSKPSNADTTVNNDKQSTDAAHEWPRLQARHQHVMSMLQSCLCEELPAAPTIHMLWQAAACSCAEPSGQGSMGCKAALTSVATAPSSAAAAAAAEGHAGTMDDNRQVAGSHPGVDGKHHDLGSSAGLHSTNSLTANAAAAGAGNKLVLEKQLGTGAITAPSVPIADAAAGVPRRSVFLDVQQRHVTEHVQGLQSQVRTLQQQLQQASATHHHYRGLSAPSPPAQRRYTAEPNIRPILASTHTNSTAAVRPHVKNQCDLDDPVQWLRDALDLATQDRTSLDWAVKEVEGFQAVHAQHSHAAPWTSHSQNNTHALPARAHGSLDFVSQYQELPVDTVAGGAGQGSGMGYRAAGELRQGDAYELPGSWERGLRDAYRDTLTTMRTKYIQQQKQQASAHEAEVGSLRAELAQCMAALSEAATRWQVLSGDEGMVPRLQQQVERLQAELAESRAAVDTLLSELHCVRSQLDAAPRSSTGRGNQGLEQPWWACDSEAGISAAHSIRAHPQYPAWLRPNSRQMSGSRHSAPSSPQRDATPSRNRARASRHAQASSPSSSPTGHHTTSWIAAAHGTTPRAQAQAAMQQAVAAPPWLGRSPLRARSASPTHTGRAPQPTVPAQAAPTGGEQRHAGQTTTERPPWIDLHRRSPTSSPAWESRRPKTSPRPARQPSQAGLLTTHAQAVDGRRESRPRQPVIGNSHTDHLPEHQGSPSSAAWSPRTLAAHAAVAAAVSALQKAGKHRSPSRALHTQLQQLLPGGTVPVPTHVPRQEASKRQQQAAGTGNTQAAWDPPGHQQHSAAQGAGLLQQHQGQALPGSNGQQHSQLHVSEAGKHQSAALQAAVTPSTHQQQRPSLQDAPGSAALNQMVRALLSDGRAQDARVMSADQSSRHSSLQEGSNYGGGMQGSNHGAVLQHQGRHGGGAQHEGDGPHDVDAVMPCSAEGSLAYLLAAAEEQGTPVLQRHDTKSKQEQGMPMPQHLTSSEQHSAPVLSMPLLQHGDLQAVVQVTSRSSNLAAPSDMKPRTGQARPGHVSNTKPANNNSLANTLLPQQPMEQEQQQPSVMRRKLVSDVTAAAGDGVVVCSRCGHQRENTAHAAVRDVHMHEQCSFHPALLENPGHLRYTPEWFACKSAGHTPDMPGCYVRPTHFYPAPLLQLSLQAKQGCEAAVASAAAVDTQVSSQHQQGVQTVQHKTGSWPASEPAGRGSFTAAIPAAPSAIASHQQAFATVKVGPRMGPDARVTKAAAGVGSEQGKAQHVIQCVAAPQPRQVPAVTATAR